MHMKYNSLVIGEVKKKVYIPNLCHGFHLFCLVWYKYTTFNRKNNI